MASTGHADIRRCAGKDSHPFSILDENPMFQYNKEAFSNTTVGLTECNDAEQITDNNKDVIIGSSGLQGLLHSV